MNRPLTAALVVALGLSLCWGVQQRLDLVRARALSASDRQAYDDLDARLKSAERARVAAEASANGQHDMNARRIFPEGHSPVSPETMDKFNAAVDADPVWSPFYRKLERRRILSRYSILLSALEVAPENVVPLEDLLVERAIVARKISHQLRTSASQPRSPEVIAAVSQATDEIDGRISKLVASDAARELKEWNSAIYLYGNAPDGPVAQDAVTLGDAGFRLTTSQLVKLALIRHEVLVLDSETTSGAGNDKVSPTTGLTKMEEKMLKREAEVLPMAAIEVLRRWAEEEHRARAALGAIRAEYGIQSDRSKR